MGDVPTCVRQAAVAAFDQRVTGAAVLDLRRDVVRGGWPRGRTRLLHFEGPGCAAVVEVRGQRKLAIDVRPRPGGHVVVEVLQAESAGQVRTRSRGGALVVGVAPGLTTLVLTWPDQRGRSPVRTAWMLL